jgi:hypothetical protein
MCAVRMQDMFACGAVSDLLILTMRAECARMLRSVQDNSHKARVGLCWAELPVLPVLCAPFAAVMPSCLRQAVYTAMNTVQAVYLLLR